MKDPFANIEHGTLAHHFEWLVNENKRGAGIYVCINETDLKGRATENVKRIRAGYIDLDGAPLDPVNKAKLRAHIITETSPGRYQAYWIIGDDMPLEEFKPLQKGLIAYFNGDPAVHDLPRVMRIPGFIHNKEGTPFLSRIVQINDIPPYKWEELREAFPPPATKKNQVALEAPLEFDMPFEYLGEGLPSAPSDLREQWKKLNSEAIKRYSDWVPDIFPAASSTSNGGYRVSSADLGRDLEEDLSFHADGIKDFGVHDMGDPREGRRTPIDIVKEHLHKDFTEAVRWLAEKLGLDPRDYLPKPKPENDSPPLLYPRDEVDEQIALGHTILVAKDKKDADRLWSIGVPATCSAHGEWTPKHSEQLRSADIVVLGNHDAACKFSLGIAKRVRILKLADVSDWLDTGHTREELDELIEHAPDYAPTASSLGEWDAGDEPGIIPPRQWLLGNQFCRGFISSIVATGGAGKSALRLLQFISMALGRSLCGQHVFRRSRVLLISLEDDRDELQRRIKAVLDHYGIDRKELKGWLFCASPKLAKLAEMKNRTRAIGPLEQHIRDAIKRRNPDIVSLDPFIKTHGLEENDSGDMDFVCDLLARMAIEFNIAVDSPHHAHKGQVTPGDADSGRGSSGIRDAGRLVYTLAPMSEADAKIFNIKAENRRSYVRLDSAKVNIAAPSAKAEWFHIIGQPIGNSTDEYPNGDIIQVVEPWSPPDAWKDTTPIGLNAILTDIDHGLTDEDGNPTGQRYSNAPQSSRPGSLASRPKTTTPISPKPQSSTHGSTPSCSTPMIASTQSPVKNAKGLKSIMPNAHPEYFPQNAPSTIFLPPPARGNMCPPCVTGRKSAIEQKAPVAVRLRHSAAAMAQAFAPCFLL